MTMKKIFSSASSITVNLKPEDTICVEFANKLRKLQMKGKPFFVWTHVANEFTGRSRPVFGMVRKAMGKVSGWPDYVFMAQDKCAGLEFKSAKGKQTQTQKDVQEWFDHANVYYAVVYSSDEAFEKLEEWGFI